MKVFIATLSLLATLLYAEHSRAADAKAPPASAEEGETVDVSKIQEKYWAQGKDTELGVVQNRKYSTANRVEIAVLGGSISSDPFLTVNHIGGSVGYHFSQYLSAHFIGWKAAATPSDAYRAFEAQKSSTNASVSTNPPKAFYGLQGNFNFLYGKASLFGKAIIYVDLFVLGGGGVTQTSTGDNITPFIGLGQKIHLSKHFALDLDYRIMHYNEKIQQTTSVQSRSNNTSVVSLGISYFIN